MDLQLAALFIGLFDDNHIILVADSRKPEGIPFKPYVLAMRGTNATLECRFKAYPEPEVTWSRDGHDLHFTSGQRIYNDTYRATYTIVNVDYNHTSKYTCLAQNPHGQTRMTVNLVVQGMCICFLCDLF